MKTEANYFAIKAIILLIAAPFCGDIAVVAGLTGIFCAGVATVFAHMRVLP